MSYLSRTDTRTFTSDTPAILTIVPETWTVGPLNSVRAELKGRRV